MYYMTMSDMVRTKKKRIVDCIPVLFRIAQMIVPVIVLVACTGENENEYIRENLGETNTTYELMADAEEVEKPVFNGSGTEDDPYLIENVEDLKRFRDLVNTGNSFDYKYFKQTSNIDLRFEENWEPIGTFGTGNYFWGFYDGNGYTISNLVIKDPDANTGLFGVLAGEVSNLGIESGSIEGNCVGSFAGHGMNTAVIFNCYNKSDVHGFSRAGGIADNFAGRIYNTINLGSVISDSDAPGGILAFDCKLVEGCHSVENRPVTYNFTGELQRSSTINRDEINASFVQNLYQKSQQDENRNTVYFTVSEGDLIFSNNRRNTNREKNNGITYCILMIISALILLISIDYHVNVRKEKSHDRRAKIQK